MHDLVFKIKKRAKTIYYCANYYVNFRFLNPARMITSISLYTKVNLTFERLGRLSKFKNCLKDIDSWHIGVFQ